MNSLILLTIALIVFIFGYRFFSKLLAIAVFRLDSNYSTPARSRADVHDYFAGNGNRHLAFGYHFAAVTAVSTLAGAAIAVIWGWIPAFLWVVVGTAAVAGTYGMGSLWLALRHGDAGPTSLVKPIIGPRGRSWFQLLALMLLLVMNTVFALVAAQLLSAFPSAALAFWVLILIAIGFGNFMHGRVQTGLASGSITALMFALAAIWLLGKIPFAFTGALNIDFFGLSLMILDAPVVWMALLFVYLYFAMRLPVWKLLQPRGYLTALLTGLTFIMFLIGLLILHPAIVAPDFTAEPDVPAIIPLLFVTLTSGAIAGFYLLIASGITAGQVQRETDIRYIGYGVALAEGVVAVCAIIIFTAGFSTMDEWKQVFASWESIPGLDRMLILFVQGLARFIQELGLGREFSLSLAAVTTLSLAVTTLEAGIRVQKQVLQEIAQHRGSEKLQREKNLWLFTIGLVAVLVMYNGRGTGGLVFWPLFGFMNQFLACTGMLLLLLVLKRMKRPLTFVLAPMLFLLAVTVWALLSMAAEWWAAGDWLMISGAVVILAIQTGIALAGLRTLQQPAAGAPNA